MSDALLDLTVDDVPLRHRRQPLGRLLMEDAGLSPSDLTSALAERGRSKAPMERICLAQGLATPAQVLRAQARHYGAMELSRDRSDPDPDLAQALSVDLCLKHGILPWFQIGATTVIATARPEAFEALRPLLPEALQNAMMAVCLEEDIHAIIAERHGASLAREAECAVRADESCRDLGRLGGMRAGVLALVACLMIGTLILVPQMFFAALAFWAIVALVGSALLKGAALMMQLRPQAPPADVAPPPAGGQYPLVSILVPLFREENIARALVARLGRLTYPKAMLDVVLVLEAEDDQTRDTLAATDLPPWMRIIEVPPGDITTKPRALNYAMRFCHGEIVGIYDAEDAPSPDQIDRVVAAFGSAPAQVACLQGVLDFYNPRANWLSRCFTIEYASWFRVILPGMARMGLAIPLGGTTVFFRRPALEHVGGWDAHNVTEDADLGIRLARYGYRTELIASVTREEANNRFWPWIKQRSRWLKGYMITYLVHMRAPFVLWQQLGAWRFIGFQVFFLTAITQFLLAPALWSFWLIPMGFAHPILTVLTPTWLLVLTGAFIAVEALGLIIGLVAVARTRHKGLWFWVPTLHLYFPLGAIAAYKALYELALRPFYWDKTAHGHSQPDKAPPDP